MPVEFTPAAELADEVGDSEEIFAEQEFPVECGLGSIVFRDWDYLDPENEVCGVLAVQVDPDGGAWRLVGSGEGPGYTQEWSKIGEPAGSKPKRGLRPVN